MDPLYLANEGKFICIVPGEDADRALEIMRADELGQDAARIGTVTAENPGKVILTTPLGGKRLLNMLEGEQLPRIC
jgi:hydrogenase expression/formation protein HypE